MNTPDAYCDFLHRRLRAAYALMLRARVVILESDLDHDSFPWGPSFDLAKNRRDEVLAALEDMVGPIQP